MVPDPISKFDKQTQSLIRRAIESVEYTRIATDRNAPAGRVHAFPLQSGRVSWAVIDKDHKCLGQGFR